MSENEEASIANRDEANKCKQLAQAFYSQGDYEKALKFVDKAQVSHIVTNYLLFSR